MNRGNKYASAVVTAGQPPQEGFKRCERDVCAGSGSGSAGAALFLPVVRVWPRADRTGIPVLIECMVAVCESCRPVVLLDDLVNEGGWADIGQKLERSGRPRPVPETAELQWRAAPPPPKRVLRLAPPSPPRNRALFEAMMDIYDAPPPKAATHGIPPPLARRRL